MLSKVEFIYVHVTTIRNRESRPVILNRSPFFLQDSQSFFSNNSRIARMNVFFKLPLIHPQDKGRKAKFRAKNYWIGHKTNDFMKSFPSNFQRTF